MSSAGIPLRVIQEMSGHNGLGFLQRYLEVTPEQAASGCCCDWVLIWTKAGVDSVKSAIAPHKPSLTSHHNVDTRGIF